MERNKIVDLVNMAIDTGVLSANEDKSLIQVYMAKSKNKPEGFYYKSFDFVIADLEKQPHGIKILTDAVNKKLREIEDRAIPNNHTNKISESR